MTSEMFWARESQGGGMEFHLGVELGLTPGPGQLGEAESRVVLPLFS
jgi:hypothetical protein